MMPTGCFPPTVLALLSGERGKSTLVIIFMGLFIASPFSES